MLSEFKNHLKVTGKLFLLGLVISTLGGCFEEPKGTLKISSTPSDLQLSLDGVPKGTTPPNNGEYLSFATSEGSHQVEVTQAINDFEEYFTTEDVLVTKNVTKTFAITLGKTKRISMKGMQNRDTFRILCEKGDLVKCIDLAEHYSLQKDNPDLLILANDLFSIACEGNDWTACHSLAQSYSDGVGIEKDLSKASALNARSCDGNYLEACRTLGINYFKGDGVDKDLSKSRSLLQNVCDSGNMKACIDLAETYLAGQSINLDKAFQYLTKACDGGEGTACHTLGLMCP